MMVNGIEVLRYSSFTKQKDKGNPAGIILNGDSLTLEQMQETAHCVGYNECCFVGSSKMADYRFQYFTPGHETPLCGHATLIPLLFPPGISLTAFGILIYPLPIPICRANTPSTDLLQELLPVCSVLICCPLISKYHLQQTGLLSLKLIHFMQFSVALSLVILLVLAPFLTFLTDYGILIKIICLLIFIL